jgi:hypothetical protein
MLSTHCFKSLRPTNFIGLGLAAALVLGSASVSLAGAGLTTAVDKLYEDPASAATVVATIPAGSKVGILWCGMQKKWCLVSFHAQQGFVSFTSLQLVGGHLAGGAPGAGNGSTSGPPATVAAGNMPPLSVVTGSGETYIGTSPVKNLVTTIGH